jgi:hypothetical protein
MWFTKRRKEMEKVKEVYPKTLYVKSEPMYLGMGFSDINITHLVGKPTLKQAVPDNDKENEIAVYQLVSVGKFKKTVTKTETVEEVRTVQNPETTDLLET